MNTPDMRLVPAPCTVMSEPHLSGYRLVLGYETLREVQDAHRSVLAASPSPSVEAGAWPEDDKDFICDESVVGKAAEVTGFGDGVIRASVRAYLTAAQEIASHPFAHPAPDASAVRLADQLVQELLPNQGDGASVAFGLALRLQAALTSSEPVGREELREKVARMIDEAPDEWSADELAETIMYALFQNTGRG